MKKGQAPESVPALFNGPIIKTVFINAILKSLHQEPCADSYTYYGE